MAESGGSSKYIALFISGNPKRAPKVLGFLVSKSANWICFLCGQSEGVGCNNYTIGMAHHPGGCHYPKLCSGT